MMMSTIAKTFSVNSVIVLITLFLQIPAAGSDIDLSIKVLGSTESVEIEGKLDRKFSADKTNWSFIKNYAGAEGLASRISGLRLLDSMGKTINVRKFADGEYLAAAGASRFVYQLNLSAPKNVDFAAHISWLSEDFGVLMLNDMLPELGSGPISGKVSINLPEGWRVSGPGLKTNHKTLEIEELSNAVILVGKKWRKKETKVRGAKLNLSLRGKWQFDDHQALKITKDVFEEYSRLLGPSQHKRIQIRVLPFPSEVGLERWRAETRGANITILSSQSPFKSIGLQRLKEQLRHEILHLWLPNGMSLTGDYSWFYEGFGVYQALKTGVWLGQIRFEDFLNTLTQAYRLNARRSRKISLVEVSDMRWGNSGTSIYALGMLVGFASDLEILKASRSKRQLSDILRKIYTDHPRSKPGQDGSQTVIKFLRLQPELEYIIKRNIVGSESINWTKHLESSGIELYGNAARFKLKKGGPKGGRQKALLENLGYNRWRKLSKKPRNKRK